MNMTNIWSKEPIRLHFKGSEAKPATPGKFVQNPDGTYGYAVDENGKIIERWQDAQPALPPWPEDSAVWIKGYVSGSAVSIMNRLRMRVKGTQEGDNAFNLQVDMVSYNPSMIDFAVLVDKVEGSLFIDELTGDEYRIPKGLSDEALAERMRIAGEQRQAILDYVSEQVALLNSDPLAIRSNSNGSAHEHESTSTKPSREKTSTR